MAGIGCFHPLFENERHRRMDCFNVPTFTDGIVKDVEGHELMPLAQNGLVAGWHVSPSFVVIAQQH